MTNSNARLFFFHLLSLSVVFSTTSGAASEKSATACPATEVACETDRIGWEAISFLHGQLDDDHNGNVDFSESDEFLREELKYENGFERHTNFHGSDKLISVVDLWNLWTHSGVHNWTVDDVLEWLVHHVELPQYVDVFRNNAIDGKALPRLASANNQFISGILGIKNPVHKQKLGLKAMDAVLFGAPKKLHNYLKDLALVASLVIAIGGCWFAYVQHKYSQSHLKKMMKDMEVLQTAESALTQLQEKLDHAQLEKNFVAEQKQHLEAKMRDEVEVAKKAAERLLHAQETTDEEMTRLRLAEEELAQVRSALRRAEKQLQCQHGFSATEELQQWLQLTHEIELKHYNIKKHSAEQQLIAAKEGCEKLRKKRQGFMGSFRVAHSNSIDDVDQQIIKAKQALEEVKVDLQERLHRWQQVEVLCGFSIVNNPGLNYLMTELSESYTSGAGYLAPAQNNVAHTVEAISVPSDESQSEPRQIVPTSIFRSSHDILRDRPTDYKSKTLPIDYKKGLDAKRAKFRRQAASSLPSLTFKRLGSTGSLTSLNKSQQHLMAPLNIGETDEFGDLPPAYITAIRTMKGRSLSIPFGMTILPQKALQNIKPPNGSPRLQKKRQAVSPKPPKVRAKSVNVLAENMRQGSLTGSTETMSSEEGKKEEKVEFFSPNDSRENGSSEELAVPVQEVGQKSEQSVEFKKSVSLEQTSAKIIKPFPKSCSDGMLSLLDTRNRTNSDAKKKTSLFKRAPTKVVEDDGSSPESTDGTEEKKKKKKTLIPKFLKREEKTKNS